MGTSSALMAIDAPTGFIRKAHTMSYVLTLFLPGEGGISPLIVCHVTKLVSNRVKRPEFKIRLQSAVKMRLAY